MLLEFYAASGDFTRRLTSVKANSKFSAPDAGPEDYFSVRTELTLVLPLSCFERTILSAAPAQSPGSPCVAEQTCQLPTLGSSAYSVPWFVQGRQEDLRSVVASLRATFGVDYIYCWHGLPAYWSGISLEVRPGQHVTAKQQLSWSASFLSTQCS